MIAAGAMSKAYYATVDRIICDVLCDDAEFVRDDDPVLDLNFMNPLRAPIGRKKICDQPYVSKDLLAVAELDDDKIAMVADIYQHLRLSESKKRPCIDYMEFVQINLDCMMRGILIDWLVEVADKFMFDPQTLYLAVNYIDRFLSANVMDCESLQLLGVACLMIASKYEDTYLFRLPVEMYCHLTASTYSQDQVVQMEFTVLNSLAYELTVPTVRCFLMRFVPVAQAITTQVSAMEVECMTNYLAELSLLDYGMLCHPPSLIAASSVFLARYILLPSSRPWNSTLEHCTLYKPSDVMECVKALHSLRCYNLSSSLPAIGVKYSHPKYKCVACNYCPPSIPREYFQDY